jgi:PEGA domain
MGAMYGRKLGGLLLMVVFLATVLAPEAAFAKKKRKKNRKKKEVAAEVTNDQQTAAREHYKAGKSLYDVGDFAAALVEFQAAYDAKPHPVVLKSIGECQVQTGNIKGAIVTLEGFIRDPESTGKEEIEVRLKEIRAMLVVVEVKSEPSGAKILIDGEETDYVTPANMDLKAGEHELVLTVEGYEPLTKKQSIVSGAPVVIAIDFAAEGVSTTIAPPAEALIDPFEEDESGEEEIEEESSGPPPAFWACAAITGVGLVAGTVFGTMALGDEEDYNADPTPNKKEAGERDALIADVSFGVAAAAAVVGIIILATSGNDDEKAEELSSAKFKVMPAAGAKTIGMSASVQF